MIISGKELSVKLKKQMAEQVATFPVKYGRVPHLVVILVGDDPASQSYVRGKAKASEEKRDNLNEVVIGFAFDKNVVTPNVRRYSTKVYKLLKLFPFDEPVDEFCFDLCGNLMGE